MAQGRVPSPIHTRSAQNAVLASCIKIYYSCVYVCFKGLNEIPIKRDLSSIRIARFGIFFTTSGFNCIIMLLLRSSTRNFGNSSKVFDGKWLMRQPLSPSDWKRNLNRKRFVNGQLHLTSRILPTSLQTHSLFRCHAMTNSHYWSGQRYEIYTVYNFLSILGAR